MTFRKALGNVPSMRLTLCALAFICSCVTLFTVSQYFPKITKNVYSWTKTGRSNKWQVENTKIKDYVNNTGSERFLTQYYRLFNKENMKVVHVNPNVSNNITTWWQAAAMIDWYLNSPVRYHCRNITLMGNWHICQDEPYIIKKPCLVYSFGIAFDFSFDDAMANLGCEVHSFDPSMNKGGHKRGNISTFYNMGLGSANTDAFKARRDGYVQGIRYWKMRTAKAIMRQLGHENRVIDVFKVDIEGHEWGVVDNMIETGVFHHIRQFLVEYHLFRDFPLKQDYVYLYQTVTKLREMGFREFAVSNHQRVLSFKNYNNQGESEYVNAYFADE